ncbi:MAG TPA: MBL fold metallo-hydrolase [Actinomycetes bacterium]|nr:MBL fold metallo-hydrolase [Actinomycetes bacterium]
MRVTGQAQRAAWLGRVLPPVEAVRAGVWSLPVPIPDSPLRYTLCYVLDLPGGLVVVDPGWDTDLGWGTLVDGLALAGAGIGDVSGVVLTHVHPDHHGLTARLRDASDAWVAMHPAERDSLPSRARVSARGVAADETWLRRCGVPADVAAELVLRRELLARFAAMARPDRLLHDGDSIPGDKGRFRAVWTPGHTPGHLCFHDTVEDLLLTGDHVLPRISPNIGLQPHAEDLPLAAYLESLARVTAYDSAEVLPAHEYRFVGLAQRVHALHRHHEERCAEVIAVLSEAGTGTVWDVTQHLSWSRGWGSVTGFMRRAAVAETAAHLHYLAERSEVVLASGEPVWLWSLPSDVNEGQSV